MSRKLVLLPAVAFVLTTVVAIASACGGDSDMHGAGGMSGMNGMMGGSAPAGSIRVDLVNWAVKPSQSSARAGSVTFWAVHDMGHQHMSDEGGVTHDLQVMRKNADGSFDMVGQVQGLRMGEAKELTVSMMPGDYELSCNVVEEINGQPVGHYAKGMVTNFKVTE